MKKLAYFAMMLAATTFVACDDDDDEVVQTTDTEEGTTGTEEETAKNDRILILNNGNMYYGIDGDISTVYYEDFSTAEGMFEVANGRSLGNTPNSLCIYGSRIYVAVDGSNTIEICNKNDYSSVGQISLAGYTTISEPRDVVAYEGYVYASLYSGHVCKIDTASLEIVGTVEVGAYPEAMAVLDGKLYVPNCNYGSGTTVSEIDLSTFTKTRDITTPVNPSKMETDAQGNLYVLCLGEYDSNYNQTGAGVYRLDTDNETYELVTDATLMDIPEGTNTLFVVNAPYGASSVTYGMVNLNTDAYTDLSSYLSADSPAAIAGDPTTGCIVLTSYNLVSGYASYTTDGYATIYSADGTLLSIVGTGVGPCGIYFLNSSAD